LNTFSPYVPCVACDDQADESVILYQTHKLCLLPWLASIRRTKHISRIKGQYSFRPDVSMLASARPPTPVLRGCKRLRMIPDARFGTKISSSKGHVPPASPLIAAHPTAVLDAACAACCIVILAASASRRLREARQRSLRCQPSSAPQHQQQQLLPNQASIAFPSAVPSSALPGELVAACTLLTALSNLAYKLPSNSRMAAVQPGAGGGGGVALEAAARLARLEALTEKQLAEFGAAVRQIDKLQVMCG
ncbi:hypothetical protein Agub_g6555, partial [Astrephomene gubernaculifera]